MGGWQEKKEFWLDEWRSWLGWLELLRLTFRRVSACCCSYGWLAGWVGSLGGKKKGKGTPEMNKAVLAAGSSFLPIAQWTCAAGRYIFQVNLRCNHWGNGAEQCCTGR